MQIAGELIKDILWGMKFLCLSLTIKTQISFMLGVGGVRRVADWTT